MIITKKRADELGLTLDKNDCLHCNFYNSKKDLCEYVNESLKDYVSNKDISPCIDEDRMKDEMTDEEYDAFRHNNLTYK